MIFKVLLCSSIILVTYGNEANEKYAVSTQSLSRLDIPASYQFTNIHKYKRKSNQERETRPQTGMQRYPVIQYAPLNYEIKPEHVREQENERSQDNSEPTVSNTASHENQEQDKPKYEHLEPKPLKHQKNENQNFRSFVEGHNVDPKAYAGTTRHYSGQRDSVGALQDYYQKQQENQQKFVYYKKDTALINPSKLRSAVMEQLPTNSHFKFLEYVPADYSAARNEHKKSLPFTYSLHDQLTQEKQQQTYAHPRLHLNIARSYNVAHQAPEAHLPPILAPKDLTLANLLLNSQNTIMLPVRKGRSSFIL